MGADGIYNPTAVVRHRGNQLLQNRMGYHVVDPDSLDPFSDRPVDAPSVSDAADLKNVGLRRYDAEPGQQLPLAYHYHDQQEEAFFVVG